MCGMLWYMATRRSCREQSHASANKATKPAKAGCALKEAATPSAGGAGGVVAAGGVELVCTDVLEIVWMVVAKVSEVEVEGTVVVAGAESVSGGPVTGTVLDATVGGGSVELVSGTVAGTVPGVVPGTVPVSIVTEVEREDSMVVEEETSVPTDEVGTKG